MRVGGIAALFISARQRWITFHPMTLEFAPTHALEQLHLDVALACFSL